MDICLLRTMGLGLKMKNLTNCLMVQEKAISELLMKPVLALVYTLPMSL